jgi:HEAT repeat protein
MIDTDRQLVERLATPHHARAALRELLARGLAALPAVRDGLHHASPDVRYYCCRYLDSFLEPDVVSDLLCMLADANADVRSTALHTLLCDRCKKGSCRPDRTEILPRALLLLTRDADAHVRAIAVEAVGQFVHDDPDARAALVEAAGSDASPAVRKKAGWYAPGGAIFRRTLPKKNRRPHRLAVTPARLVQKLGEP